MEKRIAPYGRLVTALAVVFCACLATATPMCGKSKPKASNKLTAAKQPKPSEVQSLLDEIKNKYICIESGMTIKEAGKSGEPCPSGAKALQAASSMAEKGMERVEIMEIIGMMRQGEQACLPVSGSEPCGADGKMSMEFFIMSYCPHGDRFVENVLSQAAGDLGDALTYTPRYILNKDRSGKLLSLHGQKEVDEDLRQICMREKYGLKKWSVYFDCFSKNILNYSANGLREPQDWRFCAEKAGVNPDELGACVQNEAPGMAEKDMELAQKYQAQGSPTAVYNCSKIAVGAYPYRRIKEPCICSQITGPKPATCN